MGDNFSTFFQPAETMSHTSTAMEHVSSLICLETIEVSIERSVHENFNHAFLVRSVIVSQCKYLSLLADLHHCLRCG